MAQPKNHQEMLGFAKKCTLEKGYLKSKILWSKRANGKFNKWRIIVGLSNDEDKEIEFSMIEDRTSEDYDCGFYYTISGIEGGKETTSKRTLICDGKNTGKENYTTPLTQAILEAKSLYDKKIKKGSVINKKDILTGENLSIPQLMKIKNRGEGPWRVYPMALHEYTQFKAKIHFPCWIQRKFDGIRFIVVSHKDIPNTIDGYSRSREKFDGHDHILNEIKEALAKTDIPDGI
jgi:hypothetical protein